MMPSCRRQPPWCPRRMAAGRTIELLREDEPERELAPRGSGGERADAEREHPARHAGRAEAQDGSLDVREEGGGADIVQCPVQRGGHGVGPGKGGVDGGSGCVAVQFLAGDGEGGESIRRGLTSS